MSFSWPVWVVGVLLLAGAGFAAAYLPRRRLRADERRTAWAEARAAIEVAGISRDASTARIDEAERLLVRAETIAADRGGPDAAREAANCARRADRLWRAAGGRADPGRAAGG